MTPNQIRQLLIQRLVDDFGQVPVQYLEIIRAIDELENEND